MNKNKVLVLDSDFGAAESAASVCRAEGMMISRASDGRAALEMFLIERPDAIVVSALPRNPEDFDICTAVAKDANPVPVIALVGPNEEDAFRRGRPRPSGVAAFLVKPFRQDELRAVFQRVLAPPGMDAEDEELDGVLAALNPMKPGSAKAPSPPPLISPKPSPPPPPVMVQAPAPPVPLKPVPAPAPVRVRVPAKNRPESVDSIVADILADVGIEKKQENAAFPSNEAIGGSGDRKMRIKPVQAEPAIPENRGPRPIKPRPNRPTPPAAVPVSIPVPVAAPASPAFAAVSGMPPLAARKPRPAPAEDPFIAIPKDADKLPEFETLPPTVEGSFGGLYEQARRKPGIKSLAITVGLTLAVSALIYSGLRKKTPSPIPSEGSQAISGAIPASLQNEPAVPDSTAPETARGEIEKKPVAPLPKPVPKEALGVETKSSPAAQKPANPEQGAPSDLPAGKTNPVPPKPSETPPPAEAAPTKVEPAVSKAINPEQIPGSGVQTRETSDVPAKPAETVPPPATTPAKDAPPPPPAVKPGQWVPLDQVDVKPQLINSVKAIYPPLLMQRKIEGQLQFLILISENGEVLKAELLPAPTDNLEFEAAARVALLKRKYKPAMKDGVPVQVSMPISVVFKLNR
jgi:TonB family protein